MWGVSRVVSIELPVRAFLLGQHAERFRRQVRASRSQLAISRVLIPMKARRHPWADRAGKGLRSKREWLYSRSLDLQLCGTSETKSDTSVTPVTSISFKETERHKNDPRPNVENIQLTRTRFARPKGGHRAGSGAQIRRRRTRSTRRNFQQSKSPPARRVVLAFHLLILRLCWQRLAPEHSWHSLLRRLCSLADSPRRNPCTCSFAACAHRCSPL